MWCWSFAAHTTSRHDILKGILRRVVHRAGIASTQELALRGLPELTGGAGTSPSGASTWVEARGDILLILPRGITIADISFIHPLSINTLPAAATTAGAAAARRQIRLSGVCTSGAKQPYLHPNSGEVALEYY
jgi:hypothetical protein